MDALLNVVIKSPGLGSNIPLRRKILKRRLKSPTLPKEAVDKFSRTKLRAYRTALLKHRVTLKDRNHTHCDRISAFLPEKYTFLKVSRILEKQEKKTRAELIRTTAMLRKQRNHSLSHRYRKYTRMARILGVRTLAYLKLRRLEKPWLELKKPWAEQNRILPYFADFLLDSRQKGLIAHYTKMLAPKKTVG